MRPALIALFPATLAVLAAAPAAAQDRPRATANMVSPTGVGMGSVTLAGTENGVLVRADLVQLRPGWHGIHIHETGDCGSSFDAAGGHFAPGGNAHGFDSADGPHAGDLPNIWAAANGSARAEFFTDRVTIRGGETALLDGDGAAIIVHASEDDHSDAESAGARVSCGVLE